MIKRTRAIADKYAPKILRRVADGLPFGELRYSVKNRPKGRLQILVCGVYVADKENRVEHLVARFGESKLLDVTQRWCCMRGQPPSAEVASVTVMTLADYRPKWTVMGEMIEKDWQDYDFVLFCDDDIDIGIGFLDAFIALQQHYDLALAQPARSMRSYVAWKITRRRFTGRARQTHFVESGPLVSMDKRFIRLALPFSELSPMGWGYDHVWPLLAKQAGLRLGIIDATSIDHRMRPQSALYDTGGELATMCAYLDVTPHLSAEELVTVERYRR